MSIKCNYSGCNSMVLDPEMKRKYPDHRYCKSHREGFNELIKARDEAAALSFWVRSDWVPPSAWVTEFRGGGL